jgi:hypothetical protein
MHLLRTKFIELNSEVCIISDHHQGILKTVIFYFVLVYVCKIVTGGRLNPYCDRKSPYNLALSEKTLSH